MKRAALIAGLSVFALFCGRIEPSNARPIDVDSWWRRGSDWSSEPAAKSPKKRILRSESADDKTPAPPSGQLHIIVSIDHQRATLYADGKPVASTPISTGTAGHPTPMGVFTVIQKDRHHISNLYDASMPYMQRITWSGSALHQGPLPGYPASHGCVRLTTEFAQLLWRATKLGARVIVTRPEVAPSEFASGRLSALKPRPATVPLSNGPALTSALVKTADAAGPQPVRAVPREDAKPFEATTAASTQAEQSTKLSATESRRPSTETAGQGPGPSAAQAADETKPTEGAKPVQPLAPAPIIVEDKPSTVPATVVREAKKSKPISVFVSLKEGKLYVRQGWQSLFESPVTIANPGEPIGTHVYTAMGVKADGDFRWTVVSIPSGYRRAMETKTEYNRKGRAERTVKMTVEQAAPMVSASAALDRVTIPPEVTERIAGLMMPGSSLIVSDNRLSDETNESTDFIVTTPASHARN